MIPQQKQQQQLPAHTGGRAQPSYCPCGTGSHCCIRIAIYGIGNIPASVLSRASLHIDGAAVNHEEQVFWTDGHREVTDAVKRKIHTQRGGILTLEKHRYYYYYCALAQRFTSTGS